MDLNKLIKECSKQNRKAQEELYSRYKNILFLICLKYCSNIDEAEDNLHDAFIEIFSNINQFKNKGSFEGWMKRITINKAISKYKLSLPIFSLEANIYPVIETEVEIDSEAISLDYLLKLIQELPNQYRLVFNLYELDEYSHSEISDLLGISEGTSKSNLHKAKVILKNKILEINPKKQKNGI